MSQKSHKNDLIAQDKCLRKPVFLDGAPQEQRLSFAVQADTADRIEQIGREYVLLQRIIKQYFLALLQTVCCYPSNEK